MTELSSAGLGDAPSEEAPLIKEVDVSRLGLAQIEATLSQADATIAEIDEAKAALVALRQQLIERKGQLKGNSRRIT